MSLNPRCALTKLYNLGEAILLGVCLVGLIFFVEDRFLLCNPGGPGTCYVVLACLELMVIPSHP